MAAMTMTSWKTKEMQLIISRLQTKSRYFSPDSSYHAYCGEEGHTARYIRAGGRFDKSIELPCRACHKEHNVALPVLCGRCNGRGKHPFVRYAECLTCDSNGRRFCGCGKLSYPDGTCGRCTGTGFYSLESYELLPMVLASDRLREEML